MTIITIKQALDMRASISKHSADRYHMEAVGAILMGGYDHHKNAALEIAEEDVQFLTDEHNARLNGAKG